MISTSTCSPYTCHSQRDSDLLSNIFLVVETKQLQFLINSSAINYNVFISTIVSMKLVMFIFARLYIERSVKISDKEIINLGFTRLTANNVECVAVFITSLSHKEWVGLNLTSCYIQDHGLHILHRGLLHCKNITIDRLELWGNGLTTQSSSLISDITVKCKVKKLVIDGNNTIGEDEQLYSMLSNPSTMLEELHMYNIQLSSRAAIALFTAVKNNNKLKVLYIDHNAITDDACDAITTALDRSRCLVKLWMYGNPMTGEAIVNIVNALKNNNTLALLRLPQCSEGIKKTINCLQEVINKNRESQGCQLKLRINYWYSF